jgi:hypothetical protein
MAHRAQRGVRWGLLGMVASLVLCAAPSLAQMQPLQLTGSLKSVSLRSRASTGEDYALSLNRLRVEAKGDLAPGLVLDLQYDNELLLGSYLDTADFRALKDRPSPQYWRADANYVERGDVYGRHRLYRAAVTLPRDNVDLKVGRQRIAWGTGRFWSLLDILNPVSPLALEREERVGVDAALLEAKLGPLSRASLVYAPAPDRGSPSRAMQLHGNAGGVDASLVAGRLLGWDIVGMDVAGQIGDAGIRGEAARLRPSGSGGGFNRLMAGVDYAFPHGLTLSAELYYNGAGSRDPAGYDIAGQGAGRLASLAKRYAGMYASCEITPLLKWMTYMVVNVDDRSRAVDTRLVWSVSSDLELTAGVQRFGGRSGSEYGNVPAAWQAQLQWFF